MIDDTSEEDEEKVTSRLNWVAFKQQFFTSIIIAEKGFNKPTFLTSKKNENSKFCYQFPLLIK